MLIIVPPRNYKNISNFLLIYRGYYCKMESSKCKSGTSNVVCPNKTTFDPLILGVSTIYITFGSPISNDQIRSCTHLPIRYSIFMIQLRSIKKAYRTDYTKLEVLKGIDLDIEDGEFVSIMGSSGSGKSTLLNIIGILDDYDEGEYRLDNTLIRNLSQKQSALYRNQFIGFVFQSFNLLPFKTAKENVALPLYYQKVDRQKRQDIAMEYLDRVGLKDWADHLPTQMSGGQQQRVAIARALIAQPKVILADEPTGALDSKTSSDVMNIFQEVNDQGITVIVVTHEHDIAEKSKRIIRLRDGLIERSERIVPK